MIVVFREKDCYGEMNVRTCLHNHMSTSFRRILLQTELKILAMRQPTR